MNHEPRFESYRIGHREEFQCPECGYPLDVGDRAVEDNQDGECYCSRHCAKRKDSRSRQVNGWGDVRRILREEGSA